METNEQSPAKKLLSDTIFISSIITGVASVAVTILILDDNAVWNSWDLTKKTAAGFIFLILWGLWVLLRWVSTMFFLQTASPKWNNWKTKSRARIILTGTFIGILGSFIWGKKLVCFVVKLPGKTAKSAKNLVSWLRQSPE